MIKYKLKLGQPEFNIPDGPFKGHSYRWGVEYPADYIHPEYNDRFELVGSPPPVEDTEPPFFDEDEEPADMIDGGMIL